MVGGHASICGLLTEVVFVYLWCRFLGGDGTARVWDLKGKLHLVTRSDAVRFPADICVRNLCELTKCGVCWMVVCVCALTGSLRRTEDIAAFSEALKVNTTVQEINLTGEWCW